MFMELENAVAVVTGGASGLGAATSKLLREKGMKVAIVDIDQNKLDQFASSIGAHGYSLDVTDATAAASFFDLVEQELGIPKVLVNCAGIATPSRILGKQGLMSLDFFQKIININLVGSFNMLRLAAEKMIKLETDEDGQRGIIISTASIAAYEGQIGQSAYAASKAGIVGMTLPAAREFASLGIRVNAIAPGVFHTPLVAGLPQEAQDSLAANIPNPKRLGKPEEFAKLVWHILENQYINGETIRIDGSLRMQPK
jgi:NAD(P)-dependent dehydrogenase (short-subunit alcohol dehydrogenase family)